MKKIAIFLLSLSAPAILLAQTIVIVLAMFAAAACGGMLIWVVDKNATSITMHWVILERRSHHEYVAIETNRVPIAPKKLEAFPSFFIVSTTNNIALYRVRLAEDWEIPQNFVPIIRPGAEAQPVIYDAEKLTNLLSNQN